MQIFFSRELRDSSYTLLLWYRSDQYRWFWRQNGQREWLIMRVYTRSEGAENNNCERTHYALQGEQNVWHGHVCKLQEQQDGGGSAYTSEKGRLFSFFISRIHKKIKPNIYIVFVYVQSDTLTRGYRISYYSGYANKTKKKIESVISFYAEFVINTITYI